VKFLIDAQLPPALGRWLSTGGHEAEHVGDVGLLEASDTAVWSYALRTGAVIVTKDEDFAERSTRIEPAPVIVWLRVGNGTNRALLLWIEPRWGGVMKFLQQGSRLVEVI
jgi:predicted nuclease of predicted toxin-antitoxin system